MPGANQTEIRLRLVVETPVPGVAHSLQDKKSRPLDVKMSEAGEELTFEFAVRISDVPKFFGEHVRSEGPERRFVYIAVGTAAGQHGSPWSRRMKINIHDIPTALLEEARAGKTIEGVVAGTGKDGTPAAATVPLARSWRVS
jgi:hypothetical protein